MSKVTDTAREKSRALRYARAAVEELELELMCGAIYDIQEQCDEIAYYTQDEETLMNALDGDEDAAHEFKLMFSELAGECERLCETLDDIYVTDCFDDFFVGIMKGGKSPMRMIGYDAYDWNSIKAEREFDRLTAGLPDKAWIE